MAPPGGPLMLWKRLEVNDSVVTFNWDLLTDQEFIGPGGKVFGQYGNFLHRVPLSSRDVLPGAIQGEGLFLKLHGSLNWFRCGNRKCQANEAITFFADPQRCLDWNAGDEDAQERQPENAARRSVLRLVHVIVGSVRTPTGSEAIHRTAKGDKRDQAGEGQRRS